MEITLEKIELVKDRTGVTYKEAKDALEAADGNVVDAIIAIEDSVDSQTSSGRIGARGEALVDQIKEIVRKGNVSRIQVTKEDELILNIPLSAGIIGAVVGPWVMLLGVVASFGFKCQVSVVKDTGEVIDITDKAGNFYEDAKVKGGEVADKLKEKAPGVYESFVEKSGEAVNKAKDAARDAAEKIKSKTGDGLEDVLDKASEAVDDVMETIEEAADEGMDKVKESKEDLKETVQDEEEE